MSAEVREELKRRISDIRDPTRYVIVSAWTGRHAVFYDAADDVYAMGHITPGCLVKRRDAAMEVARLLDKGRKERGPFSHQVVAVKKTAKGVRVLGEVDDPRKSGVRFKPRLSRSRGPFAERKPGDAPRAEVVRGMLFALDWAETVHRAIRKSSDRVAAAKRLAAEFRLSDRQIQAVLEMRFWSQTARERTNLVAELRELEELQSGSADRG